MFVSLILFMGYQTMAQVGESKNQSSIAYQKVITDRATKIVKSLALTDSAKSVKVISLIASQYQQLNALYETRKSALKQVENTKEFSKIVKDSLANVTLASSEIALRQLHKDYLQGLKKELSKKQVEQIKDGMTYSVFPNTYKAYQEMLPTLTNKQKKQLFNYLYEARERAMDAESSEKKHAWFGKYKGRINNYLSKEGIDMKQASTAWEQRIKAAQEAKNVNDSQTKNK